MIICIQGDSSSLNKITLINVYAWSLTSLLTALGSSALLILQPRTGVAGSAEWAILSSLLNMSDSVPPAHRRLLTISHLFRRELRGIRNRESWENVGEYFAVFDKLLHLCNVLSAPHLFEATLESLRNSCREILPSSSLSTSMPSSSTSHSPSSDSSYLIKKKQHYINLTLSCLHKL